MDIRIKDNNSKALITTVVNSSMQASQLADMFNTLPYCECEQRTYNEETNTAEIYIHIKKKLFNMDTFLLDIETISDNLIQE